ncbi:MAG: hypothetical protein SGPRY_013093, partial [Prymnesium sp.]
FFGESTWQWHVPELRVDDAIVRGPLPLMSLFTKELWLATPYGFDEALPKAHAAPRMCIDLGFRVITNSH